MNFYTVKLNQTIDQQIKQLKDRFRCTEASRPAISLRRRQCQLSVSGSEIRRRLPAGWSTRNGRRIQPVDATSWLNRSAGVS
jgi:hypothetical protein